MSRSFIPVLACIALLSACGRKPEPFHRAGPLAPPAFWVWHRSSPLTPAELDPLDRAGVRSLYWQAEECIWNSGTWRTLRPISRPMKNPGNLTIIPVFRIQPDAAFLDHPGSAASFADHVRKWSHGTPDVGEIQLDFDCPDRLLEQYAGFLKRLGNELSPVRISITALASWPCQPDFNLLADSVHSLAPMFYDLTPDDSAAAKQSHYRPLADRSVAGLIRLWSHCPRPWSAGLPNFERLSVFAQDGSLVGHLRGWDHDPLFFHPDLIPNPSGAGITSFTVNAPVELADKSISAGQTLVHRAPDERILASLVSKADAAGAAGIIYFALPGPGIRTTFSPGDLARISNRPVPAPTLEILENGAVALKNPGPADLPPRACDPVDPASRGWCLKLRSESPGAFQPTSPGEFAILDTPGPAPAELSDTVILRFSRLPGGESITSGSLVRNPRGLRWKLCDITDESPVDSSR